MPRKRLSKSKKNQNDDSFDEEAAAEFYSAKEPYEPPVNKGLETIIESRDCENGTPKASTSKPRNRGGKSGFSAKLRMMERTGQHYLYEDKEKDALRKKQVTKMFKGRKRPKWKGLTAKEETKLFELIANKSETEESDDEDSYSDLGNDNQMPFIMVENDSSVLRSSRSSSSLNSTSKFQTPKESFSPPPTYSKSSKAKTPLTRTKIPKLPSKDSIKLQDKQIEQEQKVLDDILGPLEFSEVKKPKKTRQSATRKPKFMLSEPKENESLTQKLKDADELLGPLGFCDNLQKKETSISSLTNSTIKKKNEALAKELKEVDNFLGPLGFSDDEDAAENEDYSFQKHSKLSQKDKENTMVSGVRRQSTIAKVRRSSRFFKAPVDNQNSCYGSIITEVEIKDRRRSRRSNFFQKPKLELLERSTPSPDLCEDAVKLIKTTVDISNIANYE